MASYKIDYGDLYRNQKRIKEFNNFCILGNEDFQKNQALKIVLNSFNVSDFDGFDSFLVYGDDFTTKNNSISSMIEQLNMLPFIQTHKTLVLKNFDELNNDNQARIVKYLENPSPDNIFIFTVNKLDARKAQTKIIFESCMVIESKEIRYPNVLARWIDDETQQRGLRFEPNAKNEFLNSVELDYYVAFNELTKLELYIGNRKTITRDDVINCTALSKIFSIFTLLDSIGYRITQK